MSFVDGVDLGRVIEEGPIAPARVAAIVNGVAAGLDAAHAAGLVHRDVKPANILLAEAPGTDGERAYLTDFGISKALQPGAPGDDTPETALTGSGQVLGTADYTAPEQVEEARSDARSDIYSLACVTFHALTGERPFRRETALATLIAQTKAPRPSARALVKRLPSSVDEVLQRGMAIDPAERPASAGAFAAELESALAAAGLGTAGPPAPAAAKGRRSRSMSAAAVGLVALVLAAVAAVLFIGGGDDEFADRPVVTSPPGAVGAGPTSVDVGDVRVWVTARTDGEVDRLRKGNPTAFSDPIPLESAQAVAVGFESIWVVNGDALYRLDPGEDPAPVRIDVGADPVDVAVDPNYVWVSNAGDGTVMRIDPRKDEVTGTVEVGSDAGAVATGKGAVFALSPADATLTKIDPEKTQAVGEPTDLGGNPTALAVATNGVWIADGEAATITRLSPANLVPDDPVDVAAEPSSIAVGFNTVWVTSAAEGVLERFDPRDGSSQGDPIPVGSHPADVAIGESAVYTANFGDDSVSRIPVGP
jgi:streptogramin lyase